MKNNTETAPSSPTSDKHLRISLHLLYRRGPWRFTLDSRSLVQGLLVTNQLGLQHARGLTPDLSLPAAPPGLALMAFLLGSVQGQNLRRGCSLRRKRPTARSPSFEFEKISKMVCTNPLDLRFPHRCVLGIAYTNPGLALVR